MTKCTAILTKTAYEDNHQDAESLKAIAHIKDTHKLEMWANAQRDGHPVEYRWRPLFNAAKFG